MPLAFRDALRSLRSTPRFTLSAIVMIGAGAAAALTIFAIAHQVLFRPWPYADPERLFVVRETVAEIAHAYPSLPGNAAHYLAWRERCGGCAGLAAVRRLTTSSVADGRAYELAGVRASPSLLAVLGVELQQGRFFDASENAPGSDRVVVISDALWARRYGRARSAIGSTLVLDGVPCRVIGILPPGVLLPPRDQLGALAGLPESIDIVRPLALAPWERQTAGEFDYVVIGRRQVAVPVEQVRAQIVAIQRELGSSGPRRMTLGAVVEDLADVTASPYRRTLALLTAGVIALLLVVGINLGSVVLTRQTARLRAMAVQLALGASPVRIAAVAFAESMLLAVAGATAGLALAAAAIRVVAARAPAELPRIADLQVDVVTVAAAAAVAVLLGLPCGLIAAWRAARVDPATVVRGGARTTTADRRALAWRRVFVGAQVALAGAIVTASALFAASAHRVLAAPRGYEARGAVAVDVAFPTSRNAASRAATFDEIVGRVRAMPGVDAVGVATTLPLEGESGVDAIVPAVRLRASDVPVTANIRYVSPGYLDAVRTPVLQGNAFRSADRGRDVMLVSARAAAALWPGQSPLGQRATVGCCHGEANVVGVVADVRTTGLEREGSLVVYLPLWKQPPQRAAIVARTTGDATALQRWMEETIARIDPMVAQPRSRTLERVAHAALAMRYFHLSLIGLLAVLALVSAAFGYYGVVSASLLARRGEIGIRLALGGSPAAVRRLVFAQEMRCVLYGLVVSVLVTLAAAPAIAPLLFGIRAGDPRIVGGTVILLGVVAAALTAVRVARLETAPARMLLNAE